MTNSIGLGTTTGCQIELAEARPRARNPRSPSPSPSPICRGSGMGVPSPICGGSGVHPHPHPRFAGDRGSIPIPIPDLPESGIQLSTIEYCKGVEFRLPQCLTLRLIVQPTKLVNLRKPAMSDDAADYSGTIIIYNMACHSIAQLIMSDLQTSMGDDTDGILQMTVCQCISQDSGRVLTRTLGEYFSGGDPVSSSLSD